MSEKKCPRCDSQSFYVKDSEDAYEVFEFSVAGGEIVFTPDEDDSVTPVIGEETEAFCSRCSWHDKFRTL